MKRARWLVTATLVLALAVIALGAYTRLTDAGLGCPDWPGCYGRLTPPVHDTHIAAAQARFPDAQVDPFKARNEMVHRYLAGLLGLCVLAIFVVSRRLPRGRGLAATLLALVVFQAALGMWTVTMNLMPVVVVAHLFGGFGVLALLALLRSELWARCGRGWRACGCGGVRAAHGSVVCQRPRAQRFLCASRLRRTPARPPAAAGLAGLRRAARADRARRLDLRQLRGCRVRSTALLRKRLERAVLAARRLQPAAWSRELRVRRAALRGAHEHPRAAPHRRPRRHRRGRPAWRCCAGAMRPARVRAGWRWRWACCWRCR